MSGNIIGTNGFWDYVTFVFSVDKCFQLIVAVLMSNDICKCVFSWNYIAYVTALLVDRMVLDYHSLIHTVNLSRKLFGLISCLIET